MKIKKLARAEGAFQFVAFWLLPYGQRILDVRIVLLIYMPYGWGVKN